MPGTGILQRLGMAPAGAPPSSPPDDEEKKRAAKPTGILARLGMMEAPGVADTLREEDERRELARSRLDVMKVEGAQQWEGIEASRKAEERRPFTPGGMAETAGDFARNIGKAGVRAVEGVGNLARGAAEAAGAYIEAGGPAATPAPAGLAGLSAPGAQVPFRDEPNAPRGEAPEVLQAVGRAISEVAAGDRQGPLAAPFVAREPGYIPDDFWEGMAKDPFKTLAINGVENVGPLAATMAATWVAGPAAGLPAAFAMEAGGAWEEAKGAGATDEQALQAAGMVGVANAALEYLPAGRLLNKLAKGAPKQELTGFVRDVLTQAATEGITESMQETNNILASMVTYAEDQELDWEAVKRIGAAGMIGAVLGGGVGAGASVVAPAVQERPQGDRQPLNVTEISLTPEQVAESAASRQPTAPPVEATPPPAASSPPSQEGGGVVEQEASPLPGPPLPRAEEAAPPSRAQERTGSGLAPEAIQSWIERLGPGKPGLSYGKTDGATSIAYHDKEGKVVAGAVLNADDTATDLIFTDKTRGALGARAAVAVAREIKRRGVLVTEGEVSSDALRLRTRLANEGREATPATPAVESAQAAAAPAFAEGDRVDVGGEVGTVMGPEWRGAVAVHFDGKRGPTSVEVESLKRAVETEVKPASYTPDAASINNREWFHGTPAQMEQFDISKVEQRHLGDLFGRALYLSPRRDVAQVYASDRPTTDGSSGKVFTAKVAVNKVMDLEAPAAPEFVEAWRKAVAETAPELGGVFTSGVEAYNTGDRAPVYRKLSGDPRIADSGKAFNEKVVDDLNVHLERQHSRGDRRVSEEERIATLRRLQEAVRDNLVAAGYDAITMREAFGPEGPYQTLALLDPEGAKGGRKALAEWGNAPVPAPPVETPASTQEAPAATETGGGDTFLPPPVRSATAQGGFIGKKPGVTPPASSNAFSRPEVEEGFQRGRRGRPEESIRSRIKEVVRRAAHAASREMHRIPAGAKHAPFREAMRKVRTFDPTEEVSRQLGNVISPLTDKQYDIFLRKTLLDDLAVIAETYEPGTPLPFEMTPADLAADKPRIDAAAQEDPHVKRAVEKVREVWTKARQEYRDAAAAIGMDTDFLDRRGEAYLHHQVIEHALAEGARQGRKVQTPKKRGFQKKLRGSVGDINLNYGEAQGQVLVQMALDANMARQVGVIEKHYDIADDLKAQAKEASKGGAKVNWESLIPEDHLPWQPDEGSLFYMGKTITDRIAQRLLADPTVSITPADIRSALMVGGKKKTMVLPKEIVETLTEIGQKRVNDLPTQIFAGNRKIVNNWKKLMLLMPRRVFKYATRNLIGDTQKTVMGNPAAIKRMKKAASDLADFTYGKTDPPPALAAWLARGGWGSGLFQQELETTEAGRRQRLKAATELAGLLEQVKDAKSLPRKYFMRVGRHVSFLEAVNRYANFLEYTAQMEADPDGRPKNFGASRADEVMGLEDVHDRAYWLSNQLIGSYDQISEAGQFLRQHVIPFWSFQELNVRSHWGLVRNAVTAPESAMKRARKMGIISAKMSGATAYRVAKLGGLMVAFEAFMHAWNYGFFDDEEDDLPQDIRRTPHIILGRDDQGNVLYFNRLSVFQEAREWFGVDEFGYNIMDYLDGRISGGQLLKEVASVPGNKLLNSVGPASAGGLKTVLEMSFGKTTFPQPRDIHDRWDHAYRTIGMEEEFRALTKRPTPAGGFLKTWRGAFLYAAEPGVAAYYDTLSNQRRFLASKGEDSGGSFSSARTDAMRQYKRAVRYEQPDVAEKYLRLYLARGGTAKGYKQSLARLEPMSYIPKKLRPEFEKWLTPDEVAKLRDAEAYYKETFGDDSPGTVEGLAYIGGHEAAAEGLPRKPPGKLDAEGQKHWLRGWDVAAPGAKKP